MNPSSNKTDFTKSKYRSLYLHTKTLKMSETKTNKLERIIDAKEIAELQLKFAIKHIGVGPKTVILKSKKPNVDDKTMTVYAQRYTMCAIIVKENIHIGFSRYGMNEVKPWSRKLANLIAKGRALKTPAIVIPIQDSSKINYTSLREILRGLYKAAGPNQEVVLMKESIDNWFNKRKNVLETTKSEVKLAQLISRTKMYLKKIKKHYGVKKLDSIFNQVAIDGHNQITHPKMKIVHQDDRN